MSAGVDAHVHLWDRSVDPQDWIDAETMAPIARDFDASDLSGMLASTGLDRAVVVQSSNSLEESIRLAGLDSPVVAGLVAWVDLAAEGGTPARPDPHERRRSRRRGAASGAHRPGPAVDDARGGQRGSHRARA